MLFYVFDNQILNATNINTCISKAKEQNTEHTCYHAYNNDIWRKTVNYSAIGAYFNTDKNILNIVDCVLSTHMYMNSDKFDNFCCFFFLRSLLKPLPCIQITIQILIQLLFGWLLCRCEIHVNFNSKNILMKRWKKNK